MAAPPGYVGANALAPALVMNDDTAEFPPARKGAPAQSGLFGNTTLSETSPRFSLSVPANVIPFDRLQRDHAAATAPARPQPEPSASPAMPPQAKSTPRRPAPADLQGTLDFVPAAPGRSRKLKTDVEAQVFCDQPVATPTHRFVASAIDGAIVLFGFGLLVMLYEFLGGRFGSGRIFWAALAGTFALVAMLYGLIWAIAGRETAGMRLTDLQLITFDGFEVDPRSRALRFAATWLSFCSGGLGLLWAVADEENLTWHDHISKTFPTIREVPGTFVRQRRARE